MNQVGSDKGKRFDQLPVEVLLRATILQIDKFLILACEVVVDVSEICMSRVNDEIAASLVGGQGHLVDRHASGSVTISIHGNNY